MSCEASRRANREEVQVTAPLQRRHTLWAAWSDGSHRMQTGGGRECGLLCALRGRLRVCPADDGRSHGGIGRVERHACQKRAGKKISESHRKQVPKKRLA